MQMLEVLHCARRVEDDLTTARNVAQYAANVFRSIFFRYPAAAASKPTNASQGFPQHGICMTPAADKDEM